MKFTRWQFVKASVVVGVIGVASFALIYFIPAPPSKVVMATAFKGASFEYYGRQYREIFARSHVELELRETAGAVENLKLLQDRNADVQIAFCYWRPFGLKAYARSAIARDGLRSTVLDLLSRERAT